MQDRTKSCEEFVHRAQKRLSQAEVAVTGAVEQRDRMKVEFEEGRRLANLQAEAQNPLAPVHPVGEMEAEIRAHHAPIFETLVALVFRFFLVLIEAPMNVVLPVPSRVGERGRTSAMKRSNVVHCLVHHPAKPRRAEGRWGRGESFWNQKSRRARPNLFRIGSHPAWYQ